MRAAGAAIKADAKGVFIAPQHSGAIRALQGAFKRPYRSSVFLSMTPSGFSLPDTAFQKLEAAMMTL